MKRFAIYVFYDKNGTVREYVLYCLQGLLAIIPNVLVVVNGPLCPLSREKLLALGVDLLERENTGFDFWAWKTGIEQIGYNALAEYDELLLTNNSYYGPIYPFEEMWREMDEVKCDFWGITKAPGKSALALKENAAARYLEHIQSYWIVFRKAVLTSTAFQEYWQNLPLFKTFRSAIQNGEIRLTNFFEMKGFISSSYMSFEKYSRLMWANPTFLHDMQVIDDKCPVVKRKAFFEYGNSALIRTNEQRLQTLFHYLDNTKIYNTGMIWEDLLATQPMSRIHEHLHLDYILPTDTQPAENPTILSRNILCIVFAQDTCLNEKLTAFLMNIPLHYRCIIVCEHKDVMEWYKKRLASFSTNFEFRMQNNFGKEQEAFLLTCKDAIEWCDYCCVLRIEDPAESTRAVDIENVQVHCINSLFYNTNYLLHLLTLFEANPYLGLLVPMPLFDLYNTLLVNPWRGSVASAKSFAKKKWEITLDLDPFVIAPFFGMFWFRRTAFHTLCQAPWDSDDFPKRQHKSYSPYSHMLSCILPHLVQYDGYYTAYVLPDVYAPVYLNICYTQLRNEKLDAKRLIKAGTRRKWKKFLDNPYYFYHDAKKPAHYLKYLFLPWK